MGNVTKVAEYVSRWARYKFRFNRALLENYDEEIEKGCILEVDVNYPKSLHKLHSDLFFLPKGMKIEKCENPLFNMYNKENLYVIHIKDLRRAMNYGLEAKELHRVIKFNPDVWFKPYVDLGSELRTIAKNDFEKNYLKLMKNSAFGKTVENITKYRDNNFLTTNRRKSSLVSESNYHTKNGSQTFYWQ